MAKGKAYGRAILPVPLKDSRRADHILGGLLERTIDGKPHQFRLQFEASNGPAELVMSFGDMMFLLSVVKAIQLDTATPFPDDPRAPSSR